MRIHTIDATLAPSPLVICQDDYRTPASLAACDTVIWNAGALYERLVANGLELSVGESTQMFSAARHWRREFGALLQRGGTVVLLLPAEAVVRAHHFEDLIDLNLLEPLGADMPEPERFDGETGIETCRPGGQPFHDFFAATHTSWRPRSRLRHPHGETILQTATGNVLATYQTRDAGRLLLLPQLRSHRSAADDHAWLDALALLIARLADPSIVTNAAWLGTQSQASQRAARQHIATCREQIARLEHDIAAVQNQLDRWAFRAQLVAGTGRGVSRALFDALASLTPGAQRDWLSESLITVPHEDGVHVYRTLLHGESPDETSCAQIEDEVARIGKERGPIHRVILVDCRDNSLALEDRSPVADAALADICERRHWSVMTGAQIFVAACDKEAADAPFDAVPAEKADLVDIHARAREWLLQPCGTNEHAKTAGTL